MNRGGGLLGAELYDRRFDWLVASLAAIPLIWLFYGFDAAFICLMLFTAVGALKPLVSCLGSRLTAGIFAAGVILLMSPLLRYVFYNGYCFDGAWSVAADISRYQIPGLCERGLFAHIKQDLWVGPVRDLAMPATGLAMTGFAWLSRTSRDAEQDSSDDLDIAEKSGVLKWKGIRWSGFALALLAWAGGTYLNYRAEQAAIEVQRVQEMAERLSEAAAVEAEARRVAAEKAAKRVDREWLVGAWAPMNDGSTDPKIYCATDTGSTFDKDGSYVGMADEGKFALKDNEVRLSNRTSFEIGDPDIPSEHLEPVTLKVERSGKRLIIDRETYGRC